MADESDRQTVRAEEVEGLRELITQVLREERAVFYPRPLVEDMEELRRSPAGAVIRLEEKVDRLGEDVADIREELADIRREMVTKAELHQLDRRLQGLEEATKADFRRLEEAQANFVTKEDFRSHEKRLERLEDEVRSLRRDSHKQHVNTMRMFFVLLVVMIILNGDKVIQFLNLLIP